MDDARSYISIRYRLRGKRSDYRYLNALAGANRFLWNAGVASLKKEYRETGKTKSSYINFCEKYLGWKHGEHAWLSEYPVSDTRTGLKKLAAAHKRGFKDGEGFPKFKKKGKAKKTIAVDLSGNGRLKNGPFRLKRGRWMNLANPDRVNRYSNAVAKSGTICEERGRWYLTVQYEVDAEENPVQGVPLGIDRNVRTDVDSNGVIHELPDQRRREQRIRHLQRQQARKKRGSHRYKKLERTIARHKQKQHSIRGNALRHIVGDIAFVSQVVVLEDLKTKGMTRSAKGTEESPGRNVRQKAGLNRAILDTGWERFDRYLAERAVVVKVPAAYTSQRCHACGHTEAGNRDDRRFACLQCGHADHADVNAAKNIQASGMASLKDGEVLALARPVTRQLASRCTVQQGV